MQLGDRVGPWEAMHPLGEGGMGEVWACRHVDDDRHGALKVLHSGMGADALARFKREMLALDKLRHHAVVSLLDHDLSNAKLPWLVMEKIDGESLEPVISRGPMQLSACLRPFSALADGLAQAHAYGVHHRDVKSNNVILKPNGTMVLVDFGAAIEDDSSQVTKVGLLLGTTRYLPPEVVCGEDRDNVLADIYALGMLLNECLTGTHAFRGDGGKMLPFRDVLRLKMTLRHLDPGPEFTNEVRKVVRLCTAADPDERLNRMDDMADMLEVASGAAGRTPMMSLRQSERFTQLKGQPTPAPNARAPKSSVPNRAEQDGAAAHPEETILRRRDPRSSPGQSLPPPESLPPAEGEPTVRLGRQMPSDRPTERLTPAHTALVPDETRGFDWLLLGALVFLFTGLMSSAGVLVLGVAMAVSQS